MKLQSCPVNHTQSIGVMTQLNVGFYQKHQKCGMCNENVSRQHTLHWLAKIKLPKFVMYLCLKKNDINCFVSQKKGTDELAENRESYPRNKLVALWLTVVICGKLRIKNVGYLKKLESSWRGWRYEREWKR